MPSIISGESDTVIRQCRRHTFRMHPGANRKYRRPDDPAVYWRRRFLILGAALATLAVLAWQFTRARPAPEAMPAVGDALPSAAYGGPWASPSPTHPVQASCAPADSVLSLFTSQAVGGVSRAGRPPAPRGCPPPRRPPRRRRQSSRLSQEA